MTDDALRVALLRAYIAGLRADQPPVRVITRAGGSQAGTDALRANRG